MWVTLEVLNGPTSRESNLDLSKKVYYKFANKFEWILGIRLKLVCQNAAHLQKYGDLLTALAFKCLVGIVYLHNILVNI